MRKLALFTLTLTAATFLCVYLLSPSAGLLWAAAAALLTVIGLFFRGKLRVGWLALGFGLCAGFLWFFLYSSLYLSPALKLDGKSAFIRASACSYPSEHYGTQLLDITLCPPGGLPVTVQLEWDDGTFADVVPGDQVEATATLHSAVERGTYSGRKILTAEVSAFQITGHLFPGLKGIGATAARSVQSMILSLFPEDTVPLATAIVTGDKTLFNAAGSMSRDFRSAGLSHLVAVSGLHVSYLLAIPGLFLRNRRRYAVAAVPLVLFFMLFAGLSPSVCRAGIMCLVLCAAGLARRAPDTMTALAFSLLLQLVFNPYSVASLSLQLSYASVLGILLISSRLQTAIMGEEPARISLWRKILRLPVSAFSVSVGALAATLPLSAIYFGEISLLAPLVAVLLFGFISLSFLLTVFAGALGFLWFPAGKLLATAASFFLRILLKVASFTASLPFSTLFTGNYAAVLWLSAVYFTVLILLLSRAPGKAWLLPGSILILALCAVLFIPRFYSGRTLTVSALNVGQGQCLVIQSGGRTAVVDCGSSSGENAGALATSWLHSNGVEHIDILILTHYHWDHVSGVCTLMNAFPVDTLILPPAEDYSELDDEIISLAGQKGSSLYFADRTVSAAIGKTKIHVYPSLAGEGENERCLGVLCSRGSFDVLATGDMPAYCETQLLEYAELPDIEVLIVGHHGSAGSTGEELLRATRPEIGIISVGENSYGHPTEAVLSRLADWGVTVYRTDVSGTVTISSEELDTYG